MINRYYYCECGHEFQTRVPMSDPIEKLCPNCEQDTLKQDIAGVHVSIAYSSDTLISLAEKNTRNMGIYERQAKEEGFRQERENNLKKRKQKQEIINDQLQKRRNP